LILINLKDELSGIDEGTESMIDALERSRGPIVNKADSPPANATEQVR